MMKLYGFGPTRSLRALWGLKELDVDFEFVPVNLRAGDNRRPDFLRLNPAGEDRQKAAPRQDDEQVAAPAASELKGGKILWRAFVSWLRQVLFGKRDAQWFSANSARIARARCTPPAFAKVSSGPVTLKLPSTLNTVASLPVASTVPEAFAREAPRPSIPRPWIVQRRTEWS